MCTPRLNFQPFKDYCWLAEHNHLEHTYAFGQRESTLNGFVAAGKVEKDVVYGVYKHGAGRVNSRHKKFTSSGDSSSISQRQDHGS